ncbi:5' exonuclease Apollo [Armadillidium vulgare]|nr:5' exonuclease Apollo [Armadillidium vulgare]
MNGCVIEGTPLVVDFWQTQNYDEQKVFFLTHLHADHIKGLTSLWRKKIYTSPVNCLLLEQKFQNGIVIPLELDEPHIIFIDDDDTTSITVTLIDANHVPGSVIFLFQGPFGNILYTGDMRFYAEVFEHPILKPVLEACEIDELYLDNTFLHPKYDFPSRNTATQMVFDIIERFPSHVIKLGIRSLGKEDLLEAVAQKFNSLILVDDIKYNQLQILKRPKVYTTNFKDTRFHAINLQRIHSRNYQKWNEYTPTVCIRLTALEFGIHPDERTTINTEGIFTVPYSDHSSWSELRSFVAHIRPKKIVPIVKRNRRRKDLISLTLQETDDVSVLSEFISSPRKQSVFVSIPVSSYLTTCKPIRHKLRMQNKECLILPKKKKKNIEKGVLYTTFEEEEEKGEILKGDQNKSSSNEEVRKELTVETNITANSESSSRTSNTEITSKIFSGVNQEESSKTVITPQKQNENSTCDKSLMLKEPKEQQTYESCDGSPSRLLGTALKNDACNILSDKSVTMHKELTEQISHESCDDSPSRLLTSTLKNSTCDILIDKSLTMHKELNEQQSHENCDDNPSKLLKTARKNSTCDIVGDKSPKKLKEQQLQRCDDSPNKLFAMAINQADNLLQITRKASLDQIGNIYLNMEEFNNNLLNINNYLERNTSVFWN